MTPNPTSSQAWNLSRIVRRTRQILREEGLGCLWFKVLGELCYRRAILFVCEFDEAGSEVTTPLPVKVTTLQAGEIHDYLALCPEGDPDAIRRRLASGQICFTARVEGRIINVCWIATGHAWIAYLARDIQLAPDEVYAYELFTAPEFRVSNVAAVRSAYMRQTLRRAGYRRAIAVVMPENRSGYHAVKKAGYRPVGMLRTIWFRKSRGNFGRVISRYSTDFD